MNVCLMSSSFMHLTQQSLWQKDETLNILNDMAKSSLWYFLALKHKIVFFLPLWTVYPDIDITTTMLCVGLKWWPSTLNGFIIAIWGYEQWNKKMSWWPNEIFLDLFFIFVHFCDFWCNHQKSLWFPFSLVQIAVDV